MENQRHYLPILFNCVNHEKLKEAGYELIVSEFKDWSEKQIVIKDLFTKDKFHFINQGKKLDRKENSQVVDLISLYENISLFEEFVHQGQDMVFKHKKYFKLVHMGRDLCFEFGHNVRRNNVEGIAKYALIESSVAFLNMTTLSENMCYETVLPHLFDFFSFLNGTNISMCGGEDYYIDDITGERYFKFFIKFLVYKDETRKELLHTIKFQIA